MEREPDDDERPLPGADPLHNAEGFARRHLVRGLLLIVGLAVIIFAHTFLDCAGG